MRFSWSWMAISMLGFVPSARAETKYCWPDVNTLGTNGFVDLSMLGTIGAGDIVRVVTTMRDATAEPHRGWFHPPQAQWASGNIRNTTQWINPKYPQLGWVFEGLGSWSYWDLAEPYDWQHGCGGACTSSNYFGTEGSVDWTVLGSDDRLKWALSCQGQQASLTINVSLKPAIQRFSTATKNDLNRKAAQAAVECAGLYVVAGGFALVPEPVLTKGLAAMFLLEGAVCTLSAAGIKLVALDPIDKNYYSFVFPIEKPFPSELIDTTGLSPVLQTLLLSMWTEGQRATANAEAAWLTLNRAQGAATDQNEQTGDAQMRHLFMLSQQAAASYARHEAFFQAYLLELRAEGLPPINFTPLPVTALTQVVARPSPDVATLMNYATTLPANVNLVSLAEDAYAGAYDLGLVQNPAPVTEASLSHFLDPAVDIYQRIATEGYLHPARMKTVPIVTVPADAQCIGHGTLDVGSLDERDDAMRCTMDQPGYYLGATTTTLTCQPRFDDTPLQSSGTVITYDNTPPVLAIAGVQTYECVDHGAVASFQVSAQDNCSSPVPTCSTPTGTLLSYGTTSGTCTARDAAGNIATPLQFTLNVVDTLPPVVTTSSDANGYSAVLWPPNHEYHAFSLSDCVTSVVDQCDGALSIADSGHILNITSDEPEDALGLGDGHTCNDMVITGATTAMLRSERDGASDGRVYTVHFSVSDHHGNAAQASCRVAVPHDHSGAAAIDSGPAFCVGTGCGAVPGHSPACTY